MSPPSRAGQPAYLPFSEPAAPKCSDGIASWYGAERQGNPTSSGEAFNMNAMTAAHPDLPLGTRIKVTNLHNNRSLVLRINDRGPFVPGRLLDVSRAAARRLGFFRTGKARVHIEVLRRPSIFLHHLECHGTRKFAMK